MHSFYPQDYGFLSTTTFTNLQTAYYNDVGCGTCLTTPLSTLLTSQDNLVSNAPSIDPATGFAEPIRPVLDGSLIKYSLTTTFPPTSKNLLLTTVKDEAGPAIYDSFPQEGPSDFGWISEILYGSPRDAAVESQYQVAEEVTDDIRPGLVVIGTDGAWRCPNYSLARAWASRGGNVWVGEFTLGATKEDNANISFCTTNGTVCHEDDIEIVFGTVPSPTAAQTTLIAQIQARWGAFIKTGNPNTSGYADWCQVTHSGLIPVMNLGGTSAIPLGACDPSIWGTAIQYDYQIYNQ
jgi:carboxylesterase type B